MTFATELNEVCPDCLRLLYKNGAADGYRLECRHCIHGVKIENGKRVYYEMSNNAVNPQNNPQVVKESDCARDNTDRELD